MLNKTDILELMLLIASRLPLSPLQ